jgi:hypothetical protein
MTDLTPFESRPDPVLGTELRAALDGPDAAEFLARLRAGVAEAVAESETTWDVLSRWAPRGLVAAAAAAALAWVLLRPADPGPPAPVASAPVQMEVSPGQPEAAVLTVAILEGR